MESLSFPETLVCEGCPALEVAEIILQDYFLMIEFLMSFPAVRSDMSILTTRETLQKQCFKILLEEYFLFDHFESLEVLLVPFKQR